MRRPRILIVDDEPRYVHLIRINLEGSDYEVLTATNGEEAVEITAREACDLILLDIKMPKMDGYEACREIRRFSDVPIIMLTAYNQTHEVVEGLDAGADDFVPKPFSAQELMARIRARLRRIDPDGQDQETVYEVGELRLDTVRRRLFVRGLEVHLTPIEYHLLTELISHAGRVLVPSYLLDRVWGAGDTQMQLLWQAIHRLRSKIERDPSNPTYIHTRPGIGYVLLDGDD